MYDDISQIHFWERVEALRDPTVSFRSFVESAGMRFDVALVMRKQNTTPPIQQGCALAQALGVSVSWLISSEAVEALELTSALSQDQRTRIRTLALKILESTPQTILDVEKKLNL